MISWLEVTSVFGMILLFLAILLRVSSSALVLAKLVSRYSRLELLIVLRILVDDKTWVFEKILKSIVSEDGLATLYFRLATFL